MKIIACFTVLLLTLTSAFAAEHSLGWPAGCSEGKDCWIVNYVDQDKSASARDFECGNLTYNGHDGTDIGLRDFSTMQKGVDVRAAMEGKVVRVRNDIEDHHGTASDLAAARQSRKECGNLVSLLHADKWVTEYCHMKKGSVSVALGQTVSKGTKLGEIGQSGLAEFPHLHFSLKHNNAAIDPFTGQSIAGCGLARHELWETPIPYEPVKIYATGFSDAAPDLKSLKLDVAATPDIRSYSPALVFWVLLYGLQAADTIDLTLKGPDGKVFAQSSETAPQPKISYFRFTGKNNSSQLAAGTYQGTATLTRRLPDGSVLTRKAEKTIIIR